MKNRLNLKHRNRGLEVSYRGLTTVSILQRIFFDIFTGYRGQVTV
ncbi:hypothetical protein [Rickettsia tamurae]|nr:hypothetical protein [Rickettsia tamurae]